MADSPRCGVVIPTCNRAGLLGYTLESLTWQTLAAERFEVLIGDDGSAAMRRFTRSCSSIFEHPIYPASSRSLTTCWGRGWPW